MEFSKEELIHILDTNKLTGRFKTIVLKCRIDGLELEKMIRVHSEISECDESVYEPNLFKVTLLFTNKSVETIFLTEFKQLGFA